MKMSTRRIVFSSLILGTLVVAVIAADRLSKPVPGTDFANVRDADAKINVIAPNLHRYLLFADRGENTENAQVLVVSDRVLTEEEAFMASCVGYTGRKNVVGIACFYRTSRISAQGFDIDGYCAFCGRTVAFGDPSVLLAIGAKPGARE